jgi:segregation and condensation protein B
LQNTESQHSDLKTATSLQQTPVDKTRHELALIEAALYVAGRPLDINTLCSILKTRSKNKARKNASALIREYSARNTSLEILELKDERYVLQVKPEFTPQVKRLVNRPLLSIGPLKTLSYISYRQPISQKRVILVRGHHAYGHIKQLKDMNLLETKRMGRSTMLQTSAYFADYFGLSQDTTQMKRQLKRVFEESSREDAAEP